MDMERCFLLKRVYTFIEGITSRQEVKMTGNKIRVILVCAAGMSSSLIEEKIRQAAAKAGKEMELKAIDATSMSMWDYAKDHIDVILVAPQVRFKKKSIVQQSEPYGILTQSRMEWWMAS
jgi:cellobiose-specific phosphotransferase system component IIB